MATIPEPQPQPPEIPIPDPDDHPAQDEPIEPKADAPLIDPAPDYAPETVNPPQEDEEAQSQSFAAASSSASADDFGLEDSEKVSSGDDDDDVQDLVDHMHDMVNSGRIDMDAYRGERNDDDEDGTLGPAADEE